MKAISRILFVTAVACMVYGYWGAFTEAGNKNYDEMNGMIPFIILVAGSILFIVAIVLMIISARKSRKRSPLAE